MRGEQIHHLAWLSYERRGEYMTEKEYILKLMHDCSSHDALHIWAVTVTEKPVLRPVW